MPTDKQWMMNCILAGAQIKKLLEQGREGKAEEKLKDLTSEFKPVDVQYLLRRLKDI